MFMRLDLIEFFLHVAGKAQVHHLGKMIDENVRHLHADFGGEESAFLLFDVAAVLNLADDGGIGAGSADAFFFQRLDQRRFVVTRRRFREVLCRIELEQIESLLAPSSAAARCLLACPEPTRGGIHRISRFGPERGRCRSPSTGLARGDGNRGHGKDGRLHLAGDKTGVNKGV